MLIDDLVLASSILVRQVYTRTWIPPNSKQVLNLSGTPIQKGLEDVYGLLLFLGRDPYWVHQWWNSLLLQPFYHGHKVSVNSEEINVQISHSWFTLNVLYNINSLFTPTPTPKNLHRLYIPIICAFRKPYQECIMIKNVEVNQNKTAGHHS